MDSDFIPGKKFQIHHLSESIKLIQTFLWEIIVAKSALIFWNYFETSLYNHSKGSLFFHIHLSQFPM